MKFTSIILVVVLVVALTSLILTGTILTSIQPSASGISNPSLTDGIFDEIRADLNNTNQSINQDNICYKSDNCRQSEIGQNTKGNDNSVTGFTDQSDNIPQAAASEKPSSTPISSNCPAGTTVEATLLEAMTKPLSHTTLPVGTVLCLEFEFGINRNIIAILPDSGITMRVSVVTQPFPATFPTCPKAFVPATTTSVHKFVCARG
jgi:hypothetical protein